MSAAAASTAVCIFARNEERTLVQCAGALNAAGLEANGRIHILVNGCTDQTAQTARMLAAADTRIIVHELPVGDKANAWNEYVHRIADPDVEVHVFMDGDVRASERAISALSIALAASPESFAAAAFPVTGRSQRDWARLLLTQNYLSGNLYALSSKGIAAFRAKQVRLPFGAKGEDGLITYLLLTDLEGGENDRHTHRIAMADQSTFEFESLRLNLRDLKIYQRRLRRYSERHFQKQVLYKILKSEGVKAMPDTIYEIYTPASLAPLHPRWDPINYWFDAATLRRLRAKIAAAPETI
jgi:glycosyltransferase involved in cell wall biosynthesis